MFILRVLSFPENDKERVIENFVSVENIHVSRVGGSTVFRYTFKNMACVR